MWTLVVVVLVLAVAYFVYANSRQVSFSPGPNVKEKAGSDSSGESSVGGSPNPGSGSINGFNCGASNTCCGPTCAPNTNPSSCQISCSGGGPPSCGCGGTGTFPTCSCDSENQITKAGIICPSGSDTKSKSECDQENPTVPTYPECWCNGMVPVCSCFAIT